MKHIWILLVIVFVGCVMPEQPVPEEIDLSQVACSDTRFVGTYSFRHSTGISTFYFDGSCRASFSYLNYSDSSVWYDYRYIHVSEDGKTVSLLPPNDTETYIAYFGEFKDCPYEFTVNGKFFHIKNDTRIFIFIRR